MLRQLSIVTVAVLGAASLSACVDVNAGVPYGYYTVGSSQLDASKMKWQDEQVQPRCQQWAKETNPNPVKAGAAMAWNHGVAGAAGGAAGAALGLHLYAGAVNGHIIRGGLQGTVMQGAAVSGVANAAVGAVAGWEADKTRIHYDTRSCLIMDAENVHAVPPSEARRIASGKQQPTSYAAPWQGGSLEGHPVVTPDN